MHREKGEMRYFPKEKTVLALVVSSLILFAFMLLVTTNTITNVSAVEANGVGVYWDSDCSNRVSSIDWSTLEPGSLKNIAVYIRNEEEEPTYLNLSTTNWNPSKASQYLNLGWDYTGQRINPGENLQITLTLAVSRHIEGISSFSFDILITGSDSLPGDINGDGIVDVFDAVLVLIASASEPGDSSWNPKADINQDGIVDIYDVVLLAQNLGKTA